MAKRHPSLISLSQDHHHALALALRCRKQALGQLNPGDPKSMKGLAEEVKNFFLQNLQRHFEAEQKVLFPLIGAHSSDAEPVIAGLLLEHEQIGKDVTALELESQLSKTLFNLGDLLERHINFALFPVLDWIAEITTHIPNKGEQLVHYYGYYTNV